jgi:formamidopyrimidine-DNA glycosylase
MPEGPEIWILNKAICKYYDQNISRSFGKHLIVQSDYNKTNYDIIWSFGLNGKISIDENNKLYKPMEDSWIFGNNEIYVTSVTNGIDFMTATLEELNEFVNKLVKLKAKLGPTLINQNKISGIGVAWGSEILHRAGLRPDEPANSQDLSNLAIVMIEVREEIKMIYENELEQQQMDVKKFIEDWFENLYRIRNMKIYKIGRKINISGRNWWV